MCFVNKKVNVYVSLLFVSLFLFVLSKGGAECSFNQYPIEYLCGNIEYGSGELTIDSSWFVSDFGYSNNLFLDSIDISIDLESSKQIDITAHITKDGVEVASWDINESAGAHVILLSKSGLYDALRVTTGGDYILTFSSSDQDASVITYNSWCIKNICNIYESTIIQFSSSTTTNAPYTTYGTVSSIECSNNEYSNEYLCGDINSGNGVLTIDDTWFNSDFGSINDMFLDSIDIYVSLQTSVAIDVTVHLKTSGIEIASWRIRRSSGARKFVVSRDGLFDEFRVRAGGEYTISFSNTNEEGNSLLFKSWCIQNICDIYRS